MCKKIPYLTRLLWENFFYFREFCSINRELRSSIHAALRSFPFFNIKKALALGSFSIAILGRWICGKAARGGRVGGRMAPSSVHGAVHALEPRSGAAPSRTISTYPRAFKKKRWEPAMAGNCRPQAGSYNLLWRFRGIEGSGFLRLATGLALVSLDESQPIAVEHVANVHEKNTRDEALKQKLAFQ